MLEIFLASAHVVDKGMQRWVWPVPSSSVFLWRLRTLNRPSKSVKYLSDGKQVPLQSIHKLVCKRRSIHLFSLPSKFSSETTKSYQAFSNLNPHSVVESNFGCRRRLVGPKIPRVGWNKLSKSIPIWCCPLRRTHFIQRWCVSSFLEVESNLISDLTRCDAPGYCCSWPSPR